MLVKSKTKRIFFLLLMTIFVNCANNQQVKPSNNLQKNVMLTDVSKHYNFFVKNNENNHHLISFFNKSKQYVNTGDVFHFRVNIPLHINNLDLSSIKDIKSSPFFYKLYINDKLIGKFEPGNKIQINKKVFSVRILFLKTKFEHLVEGWKGSTIFKFIKPNHNKKNKLHFKINISVYDKNKLRLLNFPLRHTHKEKTLDLNRKFLENPHNQLSVSGLYYNKKSSKIVQYNFNINKDGSFRVYQLISNRTKRKIIKEFFIDGRWQCTLLKNGFAKIEFMGKLSGYFPDEEISLVHNKNIKIRSVLKGVVLQSDKLLNDIYLNFPDNALVNVKNLIPDIIVDMPYAGKNNFTGQQLYTCNKCFLRYKVAKALIKVQSVLQKSKKSLKLFDCYRPFSVQKILFKKFPFSGYVADTIGGSIHNRGSAVDITIVDKYGEEMDMGTEFDELSIKANHNYHFLPDTVLKNRVFLKNLMMSHNFIPIRSEWWHYNYADARKYPKIDDEFLCN
ncbi:MAG: hypothetical protein B6I20_09910 [Bacteroidetes bacterium 4572_117]|nr:MAG: hypothetical protein B6I20_09910 [Bacteroidetes bacterium 4572_117]